VSLFLCYIGMLEVSEWRRRCHTFIAQNVSSG